MGDDLIDITTGDCTLVSLLYNTSRFNSVAVDVAVVSQLELL